MPIKFLVVNYMLNYKRMKSKNPFYPLSLLLVIFFMTSCRAPKDLVYKDFKHLSIEKLGFSSSLLKLELLLYNPNNFGLQLKRTDLDIFIDDNFLGHTAQEYQVNIPRRGDFTLPVQIDVDMKNMFKNALSTLLNKEVKVKVIGAVKIGKLNVYKTFPVNYEGVQKFSVF